jgi:hypothetical protein
MPALAAASPPISGIPKASAADAVVTIRPLSAGTIARSAARVTQMVPNRCVSMSARI